MQPENITLDESAIQKALTRITYQIFEKNCDVNNIVLVGVNKKGYLLAKRISFIAKTVKNANIPIGRVDISDDCCREPDFEIDNKKVIIIKDIISSGRITIHAIASILSKGYPSAVQIAVLVDRGHRCFPITPNYVGKNIPSPQNCNVSIHIEDINKAVIL